MEKSYEIYKRQVSYDGENYIDMDGVYKIGDVIVGDTRCSVIIPIYEWHIIPIEEDYDCDVVNHIMYQIEKYQVSYDKGVSWEDVEPRTIRRYEDGIFYDNSEECGYRPIEDEWKLEEGEYCGHSIDPNEVVGELYRTRVFSGHSYCDGERLVMDIEYQRSDDNGATWTTYKEETKEVEDGKSRCKNNDESA